MLFFAHIHLAHGSCTKMLKKKHTKKNQNAVMLYRIEHKFHTFLTIKFTAAVNWFGNSVSCIGTTMPRPVFVK